MIDISFTPIIKKYIAVACMCLLCFNITGQQRFIDSLQFLLDTITNDSHRVLTLGDLAYYYYSLNPDTSFAYAVRTYDLALSTQNKNGMVNGKYKMALAR